MSKTRFVTVPADDKAFLNGCAKKGVGGYKYGARDIPPDVAIVFERRNHDESFRIGLACSRVTSLVQASKVKQNKIKLNSRMTT
ncbi:major tail protein [Staphylococcus aureus]